MSPKRLLICFFLFISTICFSQPVFQISGNVIDSDSQNPLFNVFIKIEGAALQQVTDATGTFSFSLVRAGDYTLHLEAVGYLSLDLPVKVSGTPIFITISLQKDITQEQIDNLITITENELSDDESAATITSGLLQASRDVFSTIAAFQFGQTFFRMRGLGADQGVVLLNGIKMNKLYNGSPQWNNWGGLNDATRNQEFTPYSTASDYAFGGLLGTTLINTRATSYRPGFRLSAARASKGYTGRIMATYNSGLLHGKYAYSISTSRRWASEGYIDGTLYDAYSFFLSFEYKPNSTHSFSLTSIYTPTQSGKASPNTQEVVNLKDSRYNAYWGYQEGKIRNSRIRKIQEPLHILSHYWDISEKTKLQTSLAYQSGKTGNSRLEFQGVTAMTTSDGHIYYSGGSINPDPAYYQKLPSFYLSPDGGINYEEVYARTQDFVTNGQLNWQELYAANLANAAAGRNASYILYEDRNDDTQFTANSILNTYFSKNIVFAASANYQQLTSQNFANVIDLLGGTGYLDVDAFAQDPSQAPANLLHPNRIVKEEDKFRYHYNLYASVADVFAQATFRYNKVDFYVSGAAGKAAYLREGLYKNGLFPENSFGKGEKVNFAMYGGKLGATYKLTGKHLIGLNTAYLQNLPTLRNTFSNPRQNHNRVQNSNGEKIQAIDLSYIIRSPLIKSRLTGYYYFISNATEVSLFFADGLGGDTSAFVQEVVTGIEKQNLGLEFGIEVKATPSITVQGAAAVGNYIYVNNPTLYLTSADFTQFPVLTSYLKNYKLPGGPQHAFSAGFQYRDPDFWWVGAALNYFSNAYIRINPLRRTANFYSDADGLPFPEYDETIAKELLKQERFNAYYLLNLTGGKSWRIGNYSIGIFASINNALNQQYKTGGFEQARNSNYRELLEESQNPLPVFGPKYWSGAGANYFMNVYVSF